MTQTKELLEALAGRDLCIVVFKQHGALNCETQHFGPFADYEDAMEALTDGRVPLLYGQGGRPWPNPTPDSMGAHERSERGDNGFRYITELRSC